MEEYLPLIIQLISGALGGNLAGKLFPGISLGALGNSISGILGGGVGGWLLSMMGLVELEAGMGLSSVLGSIAGGGVGGGLIMAVIGGLRKAFVK
ncbi:MAG: hypothetical protein EP302_05925 [Bacteroidetes bacterium]|jgi:uncharacterized membrane protein YeaQ/YmgE (transglycosylase-associated protein family)|nr:MAG: hypothetical protein EP302_05925 [Bacteroidota bacterium]UCE70120.1 MAG: hypothetical protein JSW57_04285 [Flavobacteriaceae bacterium]